VIDFTGDLRVPSTNEQGEEDVRKILLSAAFLLAAFPVNPAHARDDSLYTIIAQPGNWTIKRYNDLDLAHQMSGKCVAIQYANGAELDLTVDPEEQDDTTSARLFVSFAKNAADARVFIDDSMSFDHYLGTREPERHGWSDVFETKELRGSNLFVSFSVGRRTTGRYQFPLAGTKDALAILHRKDCMFAGDPQPVAAPGAAGKIHPGQTVSEVVAILGEADGAIGYGNGRTGRVWKAGKGKAVIVIFSQAGTVLSSNPSAKDPFR
jgi:hypothetical protein